MSCKDRRLSLLLWAWQQSRSDKGLRTPVPRKAVARFEGGRLAALGKRQAGDTI